MKLYRNVYYSREDDYYSKVFCNNLNFIKVEYNIVGSFSLIDYDKVYTIYFYITTLEEVKKLHFKVNIDEKDNHKVRKLQTKKDIMRFVNEYISNKNKIIGISNCPRTKEDFHIPFVDFIYFGSYDF